MSKCFYCDGWKVVAGQDCRNSPIGTHVVDDGPNRCMYCDLNYANSSADCNKSPSGHHMLGNKITNLETTFNGTSPTLIWISILTTFAVLAFPLMYFFNWSLNSSFSKIALIIAFSTSFYIGFNFAHHILKAIFIILGLLILGLILYYILF
ncbi:hypothetical protein [Acinetobacter bohemicus]|uniref:hypothetical protein n=1 Tax=Acinetobacter bohemicus TaxID=1435036 RepID=UPI004041EB29